MFNSVNFDLLSFSHCISETTDRSDFQTHHHTNCEILYIVKGSGVFLIEDTAYEFSDGSVFFISPGTYHVLKIPPLRNYERCVLHFSSELLPPSVKKTKCKYMQADDELRSLFFKFDRYADEYPEKPLYSLFTALLTELTVNIEFDDEKNAPPQSEIPSLVKNAVNYIGMNLDKPLNMKILSESLYVSPTHLHHEFSRTMNISPMRYVKIKKMYEARNYILLGYPSVKVCEMLGYKDYPTFYKNYRSVFGISPSRTEDNIPPQ